MSMICSTYKRLCKYMYVCIHIYIYTYTYIYWFPPLHHKCKTQSVTYANTTEHVCGSCISSNIIWFHYMTHFLLQVQNSISDLYEHQRTRVRVMSQLKDFLFLHNVPRQLSDTILSWVNFDYSYRFLLPVCCSIL